MRLAGLALPRRTDPASETPRAGLVLARITVAPALLVVAVLVTGLPLLMAGAFTMGPVFTLLVPVTAVIFTLGLAGVPRITARGAAEPVPWWVVGGVVAVALAFLVLQLATASEQIVVRRDPASYFQFATWLQAHGDLPIPQMSQAFGNDPALSYGSPAFYESGGEIVPQFMAGLPMLMALGGWIGGPHAMVAMAPILGALAVLSFGGLTARLVGAKWAPVGALAFALTMPMMFVSRSSYSEAAALILLLGGLSLALDADRRSTSFLAGLALGLTVLVRIDGLRDVLPVVVFGGLLFATRRRGGIPLLSGLAAGAGAGLLEGLVYSRPYLEDISNSVKPMFALTAVTVAGTAIAAGVGRWRGFQLPDLSRGRLPEVAALVSVLVMIGFAIRPLVQTVRRVPQSAEDRLNARVIESFQRSSHLAVDGTRQYSEQSLYWVTWYIGIPAVLLGTLGAALLARRLLRGHAPEWLLPYAVIVWTTATTLLRPGITPDHPWASRRLISVVIPGLLLFAMVAVVWVARRTRRLGYGRRGARAVAASGALLVLVPAVLTSAPLMFRQLEKGEVAAARGMCREIGQGASVVFIDQPAGDRFAQLVRGMCGVPVARLTRPAPAPATSADPATVERVIHKIEKTGRRPVLLGSSPADVRPYGIPRHVFDVDTRRDGRSLDSPPDSTGRLRLNVWLSAPVDR